MVDWNAQLLDPVYAGLGQAAVLTLVQEEDEPEFAVTVVDATEAIDIDERSSLMPSLRPAFVVRMAELTGLGLTRERLMRGEITAAGKTWTIDATGPMPVPSGEADGELKLIVSEVPA